MRFMSLIKSSENSKMGPPPAELLQAIGRLGAEAAQAGVLVDTAGLMPTMAGAVIRLEGGNISTSEGPFAGGDEVVGGYAIFNVQVHGAPQGTLGRLGGGERSAPGDTAARFRRRADAWLNPRIDCR